AARRYCDDTYCLVRDENAADVVEQLVDRLLALAVGFGQVGDRAVGGVAVHRLDASATELGGQDRAPLAVPVAPRTGDALAGIAVLEVFGVQLHGLTGAEHEAHLGDALVAIVVDAEDVHAAG